MTAVRTLLLVLITCAASAGTPVEPARASVTQSSLGSNALPAKSGNSLEAAASKASDLGRKVAFSLIGLALAGAAIVMCFKRDFKDAIGVLAIGTVAVLLASPAGVGVLQDTVKLLFG
ncbi:MAG: hypothetical protein NVSMB51_03530 [Solirubrobacteraceae bacterium]